MHSLLVMVERMYYGRTDRNLKRQLEKSKSLHQRFFKVKEGIRTENFTSSFEQLIVAAITLMVFTKFSHFALSQNFRISRNFCISHFREISLHLFLRKKNEISRKSSQNANENFPIFSRNVSVAGNPAKREHYLLVELT